MAIDATLKVLNDMKATGVLAEYAIGGAVAAFLYIEPGATFDLDVFAAWKPTPGEILTMRPIYEYLSKRGYGEFEKEAIVIEGWPVQFLPPGTPLLEEALSEAVDIEIKAMPTRVFTPEHLMAICLQTGRPKDMARLLQFLEDGLGDTERFAKILERHNLSGAWRSFQARYLSPP